MKRIFLIAGAVIGLSLGSAPSAHASWSSLCYSGYQPCWNIFAKRYKCLTPEEERLQKFWHDYYDALHHYYAALDHIDWVAYYKNHGYQINGCGAGCGGRINYAPVFVSPNMQWAVPNNCLNGPPMGPSCGGPMMPPCGPMGMPCGPQQAGYQMPGPMQQMGYQPGPMQQMGYQPGPMGMSGFGGY